MTCTSCGQDVYQFEEDPEEEALRDAWEAEYYEDGWLGQYVDPDMFNQYLSEEQADWRHRPLLREYELKERGGILPGDRVMAEVVPGGWQPCRVLLAGVESLIVYCDNTRRKARCIEVPSLSADWIDD